jgi:hypothetical protein
MNPIHELNSIPAEQIDELTQRQRSNDLWQSLPRVHVQNCSSSESLVAAVRLACIFGGMVALVLLVWGCR